MKSLFTVAVLATSLGLVKADVYTGATDLARRNGAGQNNGNAQPPNNAGNNQAVDPALAATMANIADLRTDLAALNRSTETSVPSDLKASLLNHLVAAATGTKPASTNVQKLGNDLSKTVLGKTKMQAQQLALARNLHALFNAGHLQAAQQQAVLDSVRKILTDAGSPAEDVDTIVADLKEIAAATR